jgi:PAS domain S-box-containing protein
MNDEDKTKEQLIGEVAGLRGRIEELERQIQRQGTAGRPGQETGELEIYRTVLNATEDAVSFMDTEGKTIFVNETLARWLHTPKEKLLNTNMLDAVPEPWRTAWKAYADKAVLTGEAQRFEDEREGRWFAHRVFPIKEPDNTVSCLAVYTVDITKQKLLDAELRQSEAKYRALVEGIPAVTYIADVDTYTTALYVSPQIQAVLGLSDEDVKADPDFWHKRLHPDDREFALAKISEAQGTDAPLVGEYRMLKDNGQVVWVHDEARVVKDDSGRPLYLQGVLFDITDRRRMEYLALAQRDLAIGLTEMTQLDQAMRLCLDTALNASGMDGGAVYLVEQKSGALHLVSWRGLSPEFVEATRSYPPDSPNARLVDLGEPVYKTHATSDLPLDEVRRREGLRGLGVIPIQHQGQVIGCLNVASRDADEIPLYARTALETVGGQMGTVIRRFQAEKKFRDIFENAVEGIFQATPDGRFLSANPALARIFGYDSSEELIEKVTDIGKQLNVDPELRKEYLRQLYTEGYCRNVEGLMYRKDGTRIWVCANARAVRGETGEVLYNEGTMQDITEKKLAQEQILMQRDLALRLAQIETLTEGLELILKTAVKASGMESGGILLKNDATQDLELISFVNLSGEFERKTRRIQPGSHAWSLITEGKSLFMRPDEQSTPMAFEEGYKYGAIIPILRRREVIGSLNMASHIREDIHAQARIGLDFLAAELGNIIARMQTRQRLEQEIATRREMEQALEAERLNLQEANAALKVLLKHREEDRKELEERLVSNVKELVLPHVEKLKKSRLDPSQQTKVDFIETNLKEILSPFLNNLRGFNFTPRQLEVIALVKEGRTTKDIADLLHVSKEAIDMQRFLIRKKLGLNKEKANLRSHLLSLV